MISRWNFTLSNRATPLVILSPNQWNEDDTRAATPTFKQTQLLRHTYTLATPTQRVLSAIRIRTYDLIKAFMAIAALIIRLLSYSMLQSKA
ncbi:hypothetical protein TNCT_91691 [Trichonephila clavata]|uniref:Uncharacterized protein n=1 Tax=Trichonephila clavata TaxID=2740835 RepID=A0A8X6KBQ7_TRICU|nr:hypothetical protein TNCT_91691 [Trichonephila clavata]